MSNTSELHDRYIKDKNIANNDFNKNSHKDNVFVICDKCFWAATFIDRSRLTLDENRCTVCQETELSSFPILLNESFTFGYSEKGGVQLRFGLRKHQSA